VDIGAELYAMSAACVRAQMDAAAAAGTTGRGAAAVELADLFCTQSRLRAEELFGQLWTNTDAADSALARQVLAGRYTWLEDGIIDPSTPGPQIAKAGPGPSKPRTCTAISADPAAEPAHALPTPRATVQQPGFRHPAAPDLPEDLRPWRFSPAGVQCRYGHRSGGRGQVRSRARGKPASLIPPGRCRAGLPPSPRDCPYLYLPHDMGATQPVGA
jgi:hypothetical protein